MKNYLTDGFFKFLLGFSVILLVSFGVLFYLGLHADTSDSQAPESNPASQLAQ